MLTEDTTVTTYITPQDTALVESAFAAFLATPKQGAGFVFSSYGTTHPVFWSALARMYAAGVPVWGILDRSQEAGVAEAKCVTAFFATFPKAADDILIGTIHGNIAHLKGAFTNVPLPDGGRPQVAPPFLGPWTDAHAAGYPVAWTGSWNFGSGASAQSNNVDVVASTARVMSFVQAIREDWEWIKSHDPHYASAGSRRALLAGLAAQASHAPAQ